MSAMHNVESVCCNTSSSLRFFAEESLRIPIEFFAIECASVKVLVVMKVVVSVVKPNRTWSGRSVAAVGGA